MSKIQHYKDLPDDEKKLVDEGLKKAALKMASDDLEFFSAIGLTPDQIKVGAEAFMSFNASKLTDKKYVLYKGPIARRMFIAGFNQKGTLGKWSSYTKQK